MLRKIRLLTAGESHGQSLIAVLEGIPAGLSIHTEYINRHLKRRQRGYGRGGRMKIEQDRVSLLSGVRWGTTIGSPIGLMIENRDWKNWNEVMSVEETFKDYTPPLTRPRPGHADLAGALKFRHKDTRNILERSSARETAVKVATGAIAMRLLEHFGIHIFSYVLSIGKVGVDDSFLYDPETDFEGLFNLAEGSEVRSHDSVSSQQMMSAIDSASNEGTTLGGTFAVVVKGIPVGLGSHIQWDLRLDARLAYGLMGIQAIKAVEIGKGLQMAYSLGSEVLDEIFYSADKGYYRKTNFAGGIEGGVTNGMPVVIKAAMKPIPTQKRPLWSVDMLTKEPFQAVYERSDVCAVPSAAVIAEAMTALIIADAFLEKFGGDCLEEIAQYYNNYREYLRTL